MRRLLIRDRCGIVCWLLSLKVDARTYNKFQPKWQMGLARGNRKIRMENVGCCGGRCGMMCFWGWVGLYPVAVSLIKLGYFSRNVDIASISSDYNTFLTIFDNSSQRGHSTTLITSTEISSSHFQHYLHSLNFHLPSLT